MRARKTLIAGAVVLGLAGIGSGSALGLYEGGPPPEWTFGKSSSVLVCHPKNMGGAPGAVVFHESGKITGKPGAECCPPQ